MGGEVECYAVVPRSRGGEKYYVQIKVIERSVNEEFIVLMRRGFLGW